jgi:GH24 family phage-related lysozyme (muramidase)
MARSFTARQQAALVSFTYNVGVEALNQSTLRKRLIAGDDPGLVIRQELPRWRFGDEGNILAGLERRRAAEVNLFQS